MSKFLDENGLNYYNKNLPIIKGSSDESVCQNIEEENNKNKVLSPKSAAFGSSNIVGCKGFRISEWYGYTEYVAPSDNQSTNKDDYNIYKGSNNVFDIIYENEEDIQTLINEVAANKTATACVYLKQSTDNVGKITNIKIIDQTNHKAKITLSSGVILNYPWQWLNLNESERKEYYDSSYIKFNEYPLLGNVTIGSHMTAVGGYNESSAWGSFASGYNTKARGKYSFTAGSGSEAYYCASAIGQRTKAEGMNSTALGYQTKTFNNGYGCQVSTGYCTTAEGECSFTAGRDTYAKANDQFVSGRYNRVDYDSLFIVGNGDSLSSRSNAFEVRADGNVRSYGNPTNNLDLINKGYVDKVSSLLAITSDAKDGLYGYEVGKWYTVASFDLNPCGATTSIFDLAVASSEGGYWNSITFAVSDHSNSSFPISVLSNSKYGTFNDTKGAIRNIRYRVDATDAKKRYIDILVTETFKSTELVVDVDSGATAKASRLSIMLEIHNPRSLRLTDSYPNFYGWKPFTSGKILEKAPNTTGYIYEPDLDNYASQYAIKVSQNSPSAGTSESTITFVI